MAGLLFAERLLLAVLAPFGSRIIPGFSPGAVQNSTPWRDRRQVKRGGFRGRKMCGGGPATLIDTDSECSPLLLLSPLFPLDILPQLLDNSGRLSTGV